MFCGYMLTSYYPGAKRLCVRANMHIGADIVSACSPLQMIHQLSTANRDLEEEIRSMHTKLVEMGDPDERPIPRVDLKNNSWIVEGFDDNEQPIVVACHEAQEVEILGCKGKDKFMTVHITGCANRVLIENCKMVRASAEYISTSLLHMQDSAKDASWTI